MPIRLLLVDDSATFREMLRSQLSAAPDFVVVGEARDGHEAVELALRLKPHLIVMDVEMPRMDGYEATRRIMDVAPTPVVIVSAPSDEAVRMSFEALHAGAVTALPKPVGPETEAFDRDWERFVRTLRAMSDVRVVRRKREAPAPPASLEHFRPSIVAVGASTGGPSAVREMLSALPADFGAPVLLVQHIGEGFAEGFARWLDGTVGPKVAMARHGEELLPGRVYVAPDAAHLTVAKGRVSLDSTEAIGGFRPAATATYGSVADAYGRSALGVILSGMGHDGLEGLRKLRARGGRVIAQDEESAVVFSMPGHVVDEGLAHGVLTPAQIGEYLAKCLA